MLQIVIWMLCVYLIVKGVELRIIAQASSHESRGRIVEVATVWMIICILAAGIFFWLSIEQGNQMPMPPAPRF